jgi:hypothetical protein
MFQILSIDHIVVYIMIKTCQSPRFFETISNILLLCCGGALSQDLTLCRGPLLVSCLDFSFNIVITFSHELLSGGLIYVDYTDE